MKKIFAGGAALALAGVGTIALAGPLGAQEDIDVSGFTQLEATASAGTVAAGETLTVTSDDSCTIKDGYALLGLRVDIYPADTFVTTTGEPVDESQVQDRLVDAGFLASDGLLELFEGTTVVEELEAESSGFDGDVADDGSWTASFTAPEASGDYHFFAFCELVEEGYFDVTDWDTPDDTEPPTTEPPTTEPPTTEPPTTDPPTTEPGPIVPLTGDEPSTTEPPTTEPPTTEPPTTEPPTTEPPTTKPPSDEPDMPQPEDEEFETLTEEVFVVGFSVTGGGAAPAAPVSGEPGFTG